MSAFYRRIARFLAQPFTLPPSQLNRWQRPPRYLFDRGLLLCRQMIADRAAQMAAALTFRTIFSLLPMVVLALVVFQSFAGLEHYRQQLTTSVLRFLLPESLLASSEQSETQLHIEQQINDVLDRLSQVNFRAIGFVGLVVFIYGATALLATIEQSFNAVFRVQRGRPWYLKLTFYYTVVTLGPIVLAAGQVLEARLFTSIQQGAWTTWLVGPLAVLSPLLTTWIVLWAIFILMPRAKVSVRAAAVGSLLAAAVWVVTKELFTAYVARTAVTSLYGALGLVPLFLWWIYLTWLIVLVGLEITHTLQIAGAHRPGPLVAGLNPPDLPADPRWAIPIMVRVGQAFDSADTITSQQVAEDLALPSTAVDHLMTRLLERGFLRQISGPESEAPRYVLAMPPQNLRLDRLLHAAYEIFRHGNPPDTAPWRFLQELRDAEERVAALKTLAQILPQPTVHQSPSAPCAK